MSWGERAATAAGALFGALAALGAFAVAARRVR